MIIDNWSDHSYVETRWIEDLEPGAYALELKYREWTGAARLKVAVDPDVLEWQRIKQCFGGYSRPPGGRFSLYEGDRPLSELAEQFGVTPIPVALPVSNGPETFLIPGDPATTKVIVLQRIDSEASCNDLRPDAGPGTLAARLERIARAIQLDAWEKTRDVSLLDARNVIPFSYADTYTDCLTMATYSATELPQASGLYATYSQSDTCGGVAQASDRLVALIERISELEPDATFHIVAHSMGGLVAAHMLANPSSESVSDRVLSLVTLDSPLLGSPTFAVEIAKALGRTGPCLSESQSSNDIVRRSQVVQNISTLRLPGDLTRFLAIYSIFGSSIPGTVERGAGCIGHSCAFQSASALSTMSSFINRPVGPEAPTSLADIHITIESFTEQTAADPSDVGDPYFVITVGDQHHTLAAVTDLGDLADVFPVGFQLLEESRFVTVEIEAWDLDSVTDDQYDISSSPGTGPEGLSLITVFDRRSGGVTLTGDGTFDGSVMGPQAAIVVHIEATSENRP
jgi:hypothetical protein